MGIGHQQRLSQQAAAYPSTLAVWMDSDRGNVGFVNDHPNHNCSNDPVVFIDRNQANTVIRGEFVSKGSLGPGFRKAKLVQVAYKWQIFLPHGAEEKGLVHLRLL